MVSNMYYPYVGGIAEHIYNLSKNLRELGHTVKILTTNYSGRLKTSNVLTDEEKFIYRIGRGLPIYINKSFTQMPFDWQISNKVEKIFQKETFDIVHMHGSLVPTLPLLALKHSKSVNLITYHSGIIKDYKYLFGYPLLLPYHRKLHGHIAVSQAADISVTKMFPAQVKIIPNGIDLGLFNPSVEPLYEYNDARKKILFIGRFEPRKGLKYLLQAIPLIKKIYPDVLLIIIGDGLSNYKYADYIDRGDRDNIKFIGLVTGRERTHYYASCDILCAPSVGNESFGIVLLEAMAIAKPIVASDIAGYNSILEDGIEGFLFRKCSSQDIADKIVKILSDTKLAKTMGENGQKKAICYSWQHIAEQIEQYYYQLLYEYHNKN